MKMQVSAFRTVLFNNYIEFIVFKTAFDDVILLG